MIRFNVKAGVLTPVLPADATEDEKAVAGQIAQRFNGIQAGDTNYKQLMESLDQSLQGNYTNPNDYIDQQTVQELENFYATASGISQWDPTKQGADLSTFDAKFYSKQVPDEVTSWNNASTSVSFGGQKIADVDITKKYADLDSFLHANYTLVGAPSGRLGKPKDLAIYTEVGRAPTDRERQILRETITGTNSANVSLSAVAVVPLPATLPARCNAYTSPSSSNSNISNAELSFLPDNGLIILTEDAPKSVLRIFSNS